MLMLRVRGQRYLLDGASFPRSDGEARHRDRVVFYADHEVLVPCSIETQQDRLQRAVIRGARLENLSHGRLAMRKDAEVDSQRHLITNWMGSPAW